MYEKLLKQNLKLFYYPLQALLARENTITMRNGHKYVNAESIDFYDVAVPNAALIQINQKIIISSDIEIFKLYFNCLK